MSVLAHALRPGAYRDSIVLMQLRAALEEEPGVIEAGAVMASRENLALLEAAGLRPELPAGAGPSDLLVVVRAEDERSAVDALGRVEALLERERRGEGSGYRPRSLSSAVRLLPAARWVLVSVPGAFAGSVAREAIELGRHVFLFSDGVPLEEEVELKRLARGRGLLVMGPDCGTAILRGVGFGFANRVRRGGIGIVAASGTGLQAVACGIHARGGGISHAIGTGGRDLSSGVGGATALQALELLARDPGTRAIVLVSKPPAPEVAERVLRAAAATSKPVVVRFVGEREAGVGDEVDRPALRFARSLDHAAELAVRIGGSGERSGAGRAALSGVPSRPGASTGPRAEEGEPPVDEAPLRGFLRGLFAGGTLAHEALAAATGFLEPGSLHANLDAPGVERLEDPWRSRGHAVLDLGADEFTAGRPHPMLDQTERIRRLRREVEDPETAVLLLDVVLGDGAHPDPAGELAPAIEAARRRPGLEVLVVLVATDRDPQDLEGQAERLLEAGARVFRDVEGAMVYARGRLVPGAPSAAAGNGQAEPGTSPDGPPPRTVDEGDGSSGPRTGSLADDRAAAGSGETAGRLDPDALRLPVAAINVGLEAFHRSLVEREVPAVHVEWRPPAAGDERLAAALRKLKG